MHKKESIWQLSTKVTMSVIKAKEEEYLVDIVIKKDDNEMILDGKEIDALRSALDTEVFRHFLKTNPSEN